MGNVSKWTQRAIGIPTTITISVGSLSDLSLSDLCRTKNCLLLYYKESQADSLWGEGGGQLPGR